MTGKLFLFIDFVKEGPHLQAERRDALSTIFLKMRLVGPIEAAQALCTMGIE